MGVMEHRRDVDCLVGVVSRFHWPGFKAAAVERNKIHTELCDDYYGNHGNFPTSANKSIDDWIGIPFRSFSILRTPIVRWMLDTLWMPPDAHTCHRGTYGRVCPKCPKPPDRVLI